MCPVSLRSGWYNVVTVWCVHVLNFTSLLFKSLCRVFSFYSLMSEVECSSSTSSFTCLSVPCTNVTIRHGLKYDAWNMSGKNRRMFLEGISDFIKRLLGVSSINDSTQLLCLGCSVATFVCPSSLWRTKVIVYRSFIGLYMSFLFEHTGEVDRFPCSYSEFMVDLNGLNDTIVPLN